MSFATVVQNYNFETEGSKKECKEGTQRCQVSSSNLETSDFICMPSEVGQCPISDLCVGNSTEGECPGFYLASKSTDYSVYFRNNVS